VAATVNTNVAAMLTAVGDRFPLYADPSGVWRTTKRGSWTAGFWTGLLWLQADAALAEQWTRRLETWLDADTATQGLIFWYGSRLSETSAPLARRAAKAMAARFDADAQVVPWGTAFGDTGLRARVDGVAGTVPLLAWAGETEIASAHLRTHLSLIGSPAWERHNGEWRPLTEPPPGWTRGDAWLLLAAADGERWLGNEFAEPAHALAQRWLGSYGTGAPPAVTTVSNSDGPVDTSAAAIAAVALLKLGYANEGEQILDRLTAEHTTDGRLLNGCYDLPGGVATSHELIWGTYFYTLGRELFEHPTGRCADV
jgi:unsaturated chondroitin disaccharide hydrolase